MKTDLTAPHFTDEAAALAHYEAIRWPNGVHCLHCGSVNVIRMKGKTTRPGLHNCRDCRKPFRATMGTIYEKSHIPLHKWLLATHIMCASKKGVSAHQLWRMLGFGSYKTAWFMAHRIREAMKDTSGDKFGGGFGGVEADETLVGIDPRFEPKHDGKWAYHSGSYNRVMTLIDRDTGRARSIVMTEFSVEEVQRLLNENVAKEAYLLTDEAAVYHKPGREFTFHGTTNHNNGEYVSKEAPWVHTNTVEGYYSVFKRGMKGVYQHCGRQHLHRYTAEFDFRYSNRAALGVDDNTRTERALKGTVGRRLTYHPPMRREYTQTEA